MSDGPHYSLELRQGWKKTAEAGDNPACSKEDIKNALMDALMDDCRLEKISDAIKYIDNAFYGEQPSLLAANDIEKIESVKSYICEHELAIRFVEYAQQKLIEGHSIENAKELGLANAMNERACREGRAMEEHYLRESSEGRSLRLKDNINTAITDSDMRTLAREFIQSPQSGQIKKSFKNTGIDAGVTIE